jgi:hypothetical protein
MTNIEILTAYSATDPSTWAARDAIIAQRDADQLSELVSEMIRDNDRVMWVQIFGVVVSLIVLLAVLL